MQWSRSSLYCKWLILLTSYSVSGTLPWVLWDMPRESSASLRGNHFTRSVRVIRTSGAHCVHMTAFPFSVQPTSPLGALTALAAMRLHPLPSSRARGTPASTLLCHAPTDRHPFLLSSCTFYTTAHTHQQYHSCQPCTRAHHRTCVCHHASPSRPSPHSRIYWFLTGAGISALEMSLLWEGSVFCVCLSSTSLYYWQRVYNPHCAVKRLTLVGAVHQACWQALDKKGTWERVSDCRMLCECIII